MKVARNILLGLLVALAAAELCARLAQPLLAQTVPAYYYRQYFTALIQPSPVLIWAGRPGAKAEIANSLGKKVEYRLNQLGWRGPEFTPLTRPANGLVLGDSFSFGVGVGEDEVYTRQLEKMLPGVNVWSPAQMGYAPDQHLLLAQHWLTAFPWAFLVLQLSNNDLADVAGHQWKNIHSATGIPAALEPPESHEMFSRWSQGWNLLAYWLMARKESGTSEEKLRAGLSQLLFSLRATLSLAKERGIPVVLLQASDWGEPVYGEKMAKDYHYGVRGLAKEFSAPLVEMAGAELLPHPDLHWTEPSHRKAAEKIVTALSPEMAKRARPGKKTGPK